MPQQYKIHSIALTKNEDDVVKACLEDALQWSDFIYVYDGMSTDRTWDIVRDMDRRDSRIVAWRQDGKVFSEGLRAEVFQAFRSRASPGDWWCQLNVDEFYLGDPKSFLQSVPFHEHVVWAKCAQYYLTETDVLEIDFNAPIRDVLSRLRYYNVLASAEPRFFRHRDGLHWSPAWAWPKHLGLNHARRIAFRHYPYRSPAQIQMRVDVRRDNRARGFEGWRYACQEHWHETIRSTEGLLVDEGTPDVTLPAEEEYKHLESTSRRALKRLMHGLGVWA